MKVAVVLVSGGVDSTTVLAIVKSLGYDIYALSFDYSQRNIIELKLISENIKNFGVIDHKIIKLDLGFLSGSSLIDKSSLVEKHKLVSDITDDIPNTYVPARNTIFLSYALSFAESIGAEDIFIGIHKQDAPNYPDCTSEFVSAFENLSNIATSFSRKNDKIKIHAPLIDMSKHQIIAKGLELNVDYTKTLSCYDPNHLGESCGECISCLIRIEAFRKNGIEDPIKYVA